MTSPRRKQQTGPEDRELPREVNAIRSLSISPTKENQSRQRLAIAEKRSLIGAKEMVSHERAHRLLTSLLMLIP